MTMIAAVMVSFALACQTYSALKINANNRRYDQSAKFDRNLFIKFATEITLTIQAERMARHAEAKTLQCSIDQACKYQQREKDNGFHPN